jgi:hypothetical protein
MRKSAVKTCAVCGGTAVQDVSSRDAELHGRGEELVDLRGLGLPATVAEVDVPFGSAALEDLGLGQQPEAGPGRVDPSPQPVGAHGALLPLGELPVPDVGSRLREQDVRRCFLCPHVLGLKHLQHVPVNGETPALKRPVRIRPTVAADPPALQPITRSRTGAWPRSCSLNDPSTAGGSPALASARCSSRHQGRRRTPRRVLGVRVDRTLCDLGLVLLAAALTSRRARFAPVPSRTRSVSAKIGFWCAARWAASSCRA